MPRSTNHDAPLTRTPALEALLGRLSARITSQVWLHGLGTIALLATGWLLFAFLADYVLRVPHPVRVFHGLVALGVPAFAAWRFLIRPLGRRPDRAGLAVLLERARPGSHDLLVSAVQLSRSEEHGASPALVADVLREAESRAASSDVSGVIDERPARLRATQGGLAAAAVAALAIAFPDLARTFAARLVDGGARWPQRTHLTLEVALPPEKAALEVVDGLLTARVARGTDVPLVVRVEGSTPEEVVLEVEGAGPIGLSPSTDGTFRTVLRSLQAPLSLRATGGDDDGERARARIEVLTPPDLEGLAITIEPPAYTGKPVRVEFDRDVDVPAGSRIAIAVRTDPADAAARLRILPADRLVELAAAPFPPRSAGEAASEGRGTELVATESLRLRFELQDSNGLTNPDPGLFAVRVEADEKPQVSIFSPSRGEIDTLLSGWIPLRARAFDDYGIAELGWNVRSSESEGVGESGPLRALEWRALDPAEREADENRAVVAVGAARLEVAALGDAGQPLVEGSAATIEVVARDNRPEGGDGAVARSAPLTVHVVSAEEFLRRTQDRLARVRSTVGELETLANAKGRRARELLTSLESDAPEAGGAAADLAALHVGARRLEADARSIARELCSIAEAVLYARLDEQADGALVALDAALAQAPRSGAFPLEAWRAFGATATSAGRNTLAGQLAGLVDLALRIDVDDAREATRAAERAAASSDVAAIHAALTEHVRLERQLEADVQELLSRLSEWDNFQSILSLTKDILNRQKALRERAKAALRGR